MLTIKKLNVICIRKETFKLHFFRTFSSLHEKVWIKMQLSNREKKTYLINMFIGFDEVNAKFSEWRTWGFSKGIRYPRLHGLYVRWGTCWNGATQLFLSHKTSVKGDVPLSRRRISPAAGHRHCQINSYNKLEENKTGKIIA